MASKQKKSKKKDGKKKSKSAKAGKASGKVGKMVYYFGETKCEGHAGQKMLLGGKGANLADMVSIGLPVPPGFTITTDTCAAYYDCGGKLPKGLMDDVRKNIKMLEKELGKKFGSDANPLLVSVRSGAAVSMPGMMDTVLNLGLTDKAVEGLAKGTNNPRFAYDAYRRLINMFGDVVMGVDHHKFEHAFSAIKTKYGVKEDTQVPTEGLVVGRGVFYSEVLGHDAKADRLATLLLLPPRYLGHEELFARTYRISGTCEVGLRRAWGWLKEALGFGPKAAPAAA